MDKEKFLNIIKNSKSWKLIIHNNPDPDAIAAAFGFQQLLNFFKKRGKIFYSGIIGRAENREFVKRLKIPLNEINSTVIKKNSNIALFDCQPANQNHPLSKEVIPKIVIDHHPLQKKNPKVLLEDIRPDYGSTSSIIVEYFKELNIPLTEKIATALYYGIKTDSQNFIRDISEKDFKALEYIMPYVSLKKIGKIENPPVSKEYLKILCHSLENIEIIEKALITDAGKVPYPDVTAQIADLVIRLRDVNYALIFSYFNNYLYFSIRTKSRKKIAGKLATTIVKGLGSGGGHENSAGGAVKVIDYNEYEKIKNQLKKRYLKKVVKGYY